MHMLSRLLIQWLDARRSAREARLFGRIIDARAARRAGRATL